MDMQPLQNPHACHTCLASTTFEDLLISAQLVLSAIKRHSGQVPAGRWRCTALHAEWQLEEHTALALL